MLSQTKCNESGVEHRYNQGNRSRGSFERAQPCCTSPLPPQSHVSHSGSHARTRTRRVADGPSTLGRSTAPSASAPAPVPTAADMCAMNAAAGSTGPCHRCAAPASSDARSATTPGKTRAATRHMSQHTHSASCRRRGTSAFSSCSSASAGVTARRKSRYLRTHGTHACTWTVEQSAQLTDGIASRDCLPESELGIRADSQNRPKPSIQDQNKSERKSFSQSSS